MIRPVWAETCNCSRDRAVLKDAFPTFFEGPYAEAKAIAGHIRAEQHLRKFGAPTYWAYHAGGRHLLSVTDE